MSRKARRVLVADSDRVFARSVRSELETRGHTVEIASDGVSAIRAIEAGELEGAVVDADLAAAAGLQVLRALSRLEGSPPVVVTSREPHLGLERQIREACGQACQAYMVRPCAPAQIADALLSKHGAGASGNVRQHPPLTLASLEPGQVLLLECPGGQVEGKLSSRLLGKHPTSLAVALPRREGTPVAPPFGVRVTVGFPMPDGWYQFETRVIGATGYTGDPAILLAQPKLLSRIQRRRHARAQATFDVELGEAHGAVAGKGHDACEGGMRVYTEEALAVGSQVTCHIEAGAAGHRLTCPGTVIWTKELRDNGHRYCTGIQFAAASAAERKRLRGWVERLSRREEGFGDGQSALDLSST